MDKVVKILIKALKEYYFLYFAIIVHNFSGEVILRQRSHLQGIGSTLIQTIENKTLSSKVQTLSTQNDELVDANEQLKKDNKDLKNIVDQIRLRLARDTKMLLEYEDSEIRKALIRLFRWTLG